MKAHQGVRPHDIVVLLKIISLDKNWLNKDLASSLYISNSEISESLNRSMIA
jgi:predicted transcriptional regulator